MNGVLKVTGVSSFKIAMSFLKLEIWKSGCLMISLMRMSTLWVSFLRARLYSPSEALISLAENLREFEKFVKFYFA